MTNGSDRENCAACGHTIDAAAKTCPYCGADPVSGEKDVDTQAILQEVFQPKTMTTSESVLEYARQRQGIVMAISILAAFLLLAALHQFATMRNESAVTDSPAVPLTEITDVTNRATETPVPVPELDFQHDGRPQAMRTFIVERGAVAPAPPAPAPGAVAPNAAAARPLAPRPVPVAPRPVPVAPRPVPRRPATTSAPR